MRPFVLLMMVLSLAFQRACAGTELLPVKGTPVVDATKLSDFRLIGEGLKADFSFIAVEGQPFDRAIRVQVAAQTPNVYTEFTVDAHDEQGQARYLRDFLTAVFSHPSTDAFTMWGFWEGKMYSPLAALIRKDWTLKPNGRAWMDLVLKEWWTDGTATTGPDGSCTMRGFLGEYKITVTVVGREKSTLVNLTRPAVTTVLALD